jgi:short subunit dehydrogenase-like uncharacterized protein
MTSTTTPTVVVYGATGYTGRLVAAELVGRGVPVVLAGRSAERLRAVADRLRSGVGRQGGAPAAEGGGSTPAVDVAVAPLDDEAALFRALRRGRVVANCAGPFVRTGDPVLRAAIAAGVHYLDTTGEQDWIRRTFEVHDAALRGAGVAAVPGAAFDYLPGDLLAHLVGAPLEPLERLSVAYHVVGFGMTRGTQRSALEMLDGRDVAYEDGDWAPGGDRPRRASVVFPAPVGRQTVARYPAGEVVMVPRHVETRRVDARISTVSVVPPVAARALPALQPLLERVLRTPVKGLLDRAIDRLPEGPPEDERRAARWTVAVTAEAVDGRVARGVVRGPDIYGLTARLIADGALALAHPSFAGRGALAPAQAFDPETTLDGLADFGVTYELDPPHGPEGAAARPAAVGTEAGR